MKLTDVTNSLNSPLLKPRARVLEAPAGAILEDLSLADWNCGKLNVSAIAKVFTHTDNGNTIFVAEVVFLDMNSTGIFHPWRTYRIDGVAQWDPALRAQVELLLKKSLVGIV